jgi:hypothetical protein
MKGKIEFAGLVLAMRLTTACAYAQMPEGSNSTKGVPMSGNVPGPDTTGVQQELAREKAPAGPLRISFGKNSAEWTPATLAALPHQTVTVFNEHAKASQTYSGVLLMDLLKPLGVAEKPHGKDLRFYVVAEGSDGYQVVYSIGEVTPDLHDGTVLVADAMDGKSLGDNGPLQLVATGEKRPARWVRNLVAIRVKTAE